MKNTRKGITLISLVVTIIIILILSAITINSITSDNGLLRYVFYAKEETQKKQLKEQVELVLSDYSIEKNTNEGINFISYVSKGLDTEVLQDNNNSYYCILGKYKVLFNENSVTDIYKYEIQVSHIYDSVAHMKNSNDMSVGQVVLTNGYWDKTYGGSAYYTITASPNTTVDDFICIQLNNGLYANLYPINNMITVNQFGAYGDGEHDDSSAIQLALNSGYTNIKLESSRYKCCTSITISTPSVNFYGDNSTLFTDDNFTDTKEWFFIAYADNLNIYNMKIESLETTKVGYTTQLKISDCNNVLIDNCSFIFPESSFGRNSGNIDLYTGWHNVTISNCDLQLLHDSESGGCIWIRDLFERDCDNLKFINNTCTKKTHDEILAIFRGSIQDITISGNKFYIEEGNSTPSVMNFTLGSASSTKADNITFSNNEIEAKSSGGLFWFTNSSNINLTNNKIHYTKSSRSTSPAYVFRAVSNASNINITDNDITVDRDDSTSTPLYVVGIKSTLKNNTVTLNAQTDECFTGSPLIIGNTIILNKPCKNVFNYVLGQCSNNTIISNTTLNNVFQWYSAPLSTDIIINDNTLICNADTAPTSTFAAINSVTLNGHTVTFENNSIVSDALSKRARYLFLILKDTTPQTVIFRNNSLGKFKNIYTNNPISHNIVFENND